MMCRQELILNFLVLINIWWSPMFSEGQMLNLTKKLFKDSIEKTVDILVRKLGCPKMDGRSMDRPPQEHADKPLTVYTSLFIQDVGSLNEIDMDFRLDFILKQVWHVFGDDCASYKELQEGKGYNMSLSSWPPVIITKSEFSLYWIPDTYIENARKIESPIKHARPENMVMKLSDDVCEMQYTIRLAAIVGCEMNFRNYPLDIQHCPVKLRSYSDPSKIVVFKWGEKIQWNSREAILLEHRWSVTLQETRRNVLSENYIILLAVFHFQRLVGQQIAHVYIPSALGVMLSWSPFWLSVKNISDRIAIGVTCLLTLITQLTNAGMRLPPNSEINNGGLWIIVCMVFVMASIFESTWIANKLRRMKKDFPKENAQRTPSSGIFQNKGITRSSVFHRSLQSQAVLASVTKTRNTGRQRVHTSNCGSSFLSLLLGMNDERSEIEKAVSVDRTSKRLFPLAFAGFCIAYWFYVVIEVEN